MRNLQSDLADAIAAFTHADGVREAALPGTRCIKLSHPNHPNKQHWRRSLSFIAQGSKEVTLGREVYRYDESHFIATPIDLPVTGRVCTATPEKPFLCLQIDLDPMTLSEIAAQSERGTVNQSESPVRAIFIGQTTDPILDAAVRLAKLCRAPEDALVLGPLVVKEILYHLLKGPDGAAIRQFVRSGSNMHKISESIYTLRCALDDEVDIGELARAANMSRSAFFQHFKEVTAMSPIQYQKRLRLLEARRLMVDGGDTAEASAFKVGYNSASQFSREYSRMFGNSPLRDALTIKKSDHAAYGS